MLGYELSVINENDSFGMAINIDQIMNRSLNDGQVVELELRNTAIKIICLRRALINIKRIVLLVILILFNEYFPFEPTIYIHNILLFLVFYQLVFLIPVEC